MPIVHLPTFLSESRHPALVKASKACGAMYSNTVTATNFIDRVLATVRDVIIADLVGAFASAMSAGSDGCAVAHVGLRHDHPVDHGVWDDSNYWHVP